jgi:hypothetical protein
MEGERLADREITYVQLSGGQYVAPEKLVCPECKTLDLGTTVDTTTVPWRAHCVRGHRWAIRQQDA